MEPVSILAAPAPAAGSSAAVSVGIAVVALVVALVQFKRKKTPKLVGWLMLVAGAGIAGGAGLAGDFLRQLGNFVSGAVSVGTAKVFGVAVPAAVVLGVALWIGHDLWPKTKTPSRG